MVLCRRKKSQIGKIVVALSFHMGYNVLVVCC